MAARSHWTGPELPGPQGEHGEGGTEREEGKSGRSFFGNSVWLLPHPLAQELFLPGKLRPHSMGLPVEM